MSKPPINLEKWEQAKKSFRTKFSTALFNAPPRKPSKRDRRMYDILDTIEFRRIAEAPRVPLLEDPLLPKIETIVRAADSRKAQSISVFRVHHLTETTTFMVLIEGTSKPQNQAIAAAVEDDIIEHYNESPLNKEGTAVSGWMLLDYGSIIVHIMTPQMRNFYKLEKKWQAAEFMDVDYLLVQDNNLGSGATYNAADDIDNRVGWEDDSFAEDDPFWS